MEKIEEKKIVKKKKKRIEETSSKKKIIENRKKKELASQPALSKKKKKKRRKLTEEEILLRNKKRRKKNLVEIVKFFIPVVIMASLVFYFILSTSPHKVDGDSMNPTLTNGDRVITRRTKTPNRYEVITFTPPTESKFQYVKRVIGMPGDFIWLDGNFLFINQQTNNIVGKQAAANELPDGTIKVNISQISAEQLGELKKIPKDYYFVMGDNRGNSSDSREFGLVNKSSIEGVVSVRFAPFNRISWIK